jgi:ATP-dependent protease Clp ATPase subunit
VGCVMQTLAVAVHNHYKRVKYEGKRRKKVAETSASQRSSKPLRQDAAATAAEMAAEASQQQGDGKGGGSGDSSAGDSANAEAEDAAADRVKFSGRELPDVELDKSNVLLLVRGCLLLINWIGGLLAGC